MIHIQYRPHVWSRKHKGIFKLIFGPIVTVDMRITNILFTTILCSYIILI